MEEGQLQTCAIYEAWKCQEVLNPTAKDKEWDFVTYVIQVSSIQHKSSSFWLSDVEFICFYLDFILLF